MLNQILEPYGYSESEAGIDGAILIITGLVFAALTSPIIDRTHAYLFSIKLFVPTIATCYLIFVWMPGAGSIGAPYAVSAVLGAANFALVPIALEYLVEISWPASPEVSSTVCWAGGQLLGGIFIVIMGALKGAKGEPPGSMKRALIFEAVLACAVVPLPLLLGVKRLGLAEGGVSKRLGQDRAGEEEVGVVEYDRDR